MPLARYVEPVSYRAVLGNLGLVMMLLAGVLLVPLLVSIIVAEFSYSIIFGSLAVGSFVVGRLASKLGSASLSGKEAMVVTGLAYLFFALVGAIAFLPTSGFLNAFFESMSGFTTTGLTVLNVDELPKTLLFFRSYSQWAGGAGIVVVSLAILIGPGRNAFRLYASEYGEEKIVGDVKATARIVLRIYLLMTVLGYAAYVATGAGWFDSLMLSMSTVSTGGFSPFSSGAGLHSQPVHLVAMIVFMIAGAIGFPAYYLLRRRGVKRFFREVQIRYLLLITGTVSVICFVAWGSQVNKIIASVFHVTSAITTTGFSIVDYPSLPKVIVFLTMVLMLLGGSAGSTAGGLKLFRFAVLVQAVKWRFTRALLPEEAAVSIKIHDAAVSERSLTRIFSFFVLYLALLAASTFVLVAYGYSIQDSAFECTSALGTVGLSSGVTSPSLSVVPKLVLTLDMWAGRLEILPVLFAFYPRLWAVKRS